MILSIFKLTSTAFLYAIVDELYEEVYHSSYDVSHDWEFVA